MIEKKKYKSVKKNEFRQKMKNQRIISLPSQFPPRMKKLNLIRI